ncbi:MAG: hypothetical protein K0U12_04375 [Gammaproteobacteria bacterium]|nr:hypothetical protein [Gammaproteobacteria bacterium]
MPSRLESGWLLCRSSFGLMRQHKSLLFYVITNHLICLAVFALFFSPIYHHELMAIKANQLTWVTIVVPIVILMIYFIFHHFFHIYFYTALTAAIIAIWTQGKTSLRSSFKTTNALLKKLLKWTVVICIFGVHLRVIEGWAENWHRFKLIKKYLTGLNWGIASYLVIPVLVCDKTSVTESLKTSSQLMQKHWGNQVNPNFHLGIIFLPLIIISLIPFLIGLYFGGHPNVAIGTAISAILVLIISSINSTIYTIIKCYAYCHIAQKIDPALMPVEIVDFFKKKD